MASYSIVLKNSVYKDLAPIPQKDVQTIIKAVQSLAENPRPIQSKKLSGDEKYRLRCGNNRILYEINDTAVVIRCCDLRCQDWPQKRHLPPPLKPHRTSGLAATCRVFPRPDLRSAANPSGTTTSEETRSRPVFTQDNLTSHQTAIFTASNLPRVVIAGK